MAMSNGKFGVCVVSAFLATMVLFSGGKRQSQAETASGTNQSEVGYVYPRDVKPECRAEYDLAYRIDWFYEPIDLKREAELHAKHVYEDCDRGKPSPELEAKWAADTNARKRANEEIRRRAGSH